MKKHFFLYAVVAAVAMMCLSACGEKLEPYLPEVIESEVTGKGVDSNVTVKTSTDKDGINTQSLSYKSWIQVKGETKGAFDNTVTVNLTNTLVDTDTTTFYQADTTIVWGNLDLTDYTTHTSYRVRGTRQEGFVTVTDSVLVYTIDYGGFSYDYELDYEVAVYDDGVTREVMPYHRIESIVDKGVTSSRLETNDDGILVYARKKLEHTIAAECNGKTYEVKARVILCKQIGLASEPYVKQSEVVGSHFQAVDNGAVLSFIEVKRTWSDGRNETKELCVQLNAYIMDYPLGFEMVTGYADHLRIVSNSLSNGRKSDFVASDEYPYVVCEYAYQNWNIEYNYFGISIEFCHNEAYYDDGYSCYKFPNFVFSEITSYEPRLVAENSGYNDKGHYQVYWVHQTVSAKFGDMYLEKTAVFEMDAYD